MNIENINKTSNIGKNYNTGFEKDKIEKNQKIQENKINISATDKKNIKFNLISELMIKKEIQDKINNLNNELKKYKLKKYEKINDLEELKKDIAEIKKGGQLYLKLKEMNDLKQEIVEIENERMRKIIELKELINKNTIDISGYEISKKWFNQNE